MPRSTTRLLAALLAWLLAFATTATADLTVNELIGFGARQVSAGGGAAPTLYPVFAGHESRGSTLSALGSWTTSTSFSLGTPHAKRRIFIAVCCTSGYTSVTINSVSATLVANGTNAACYDASVPTGTSSTVTIQAGFGSTTNAIVTVYVLYSDGVLDTATQSAVTGTTAITLSDLTTAVNGSAFGWVVNNGSSSVSESASWNGTDTFVEDVDTVSSGGSGSSWSNAAYSVKTTEADATHDLTVTPSASSTRYGCAVSYSAPT